MPAYLETAARAGQVIGYDPRLHSPDQLVRLKAAAEKTGATLKPVSANPLDLAWPDRPAQPQAAIRPHPLECAGEDGDAKRTRVGRDLEQAGADVAVLTAPSSIAWLFNLRGGDVIRSPPAARPSPPARRWVSAAVRRSREAWPGHAGLARQRRHAGAAGRSGSGAAGADWPARSGRPGPVLRLVLRHAAGGRRHGHTCGGPLRPAEGLQEPGGDRGRTPRPRSGRGRCRPLPALAGHRRPDQPARRSGGRHPAGGFPGGHRRAEGPQLRHHRRGRAERRHRPLSPDAQDQPSGGARPVAAGGLRRPVSGRHHRYYPYRRHRRAERGRCAIASPGC